MTRPATWRISYLVREAAKNVLGARSRLFPYAAAAALSAVLTVIGLTAQSIGFVGAIGDAREMGRNIVVVESASPDRSVRISRESCERMTDLPTVVRSGFIVNRGRQAVFPIGSDLPVVEASRSLVSLTGSNVAVVGGALYSSGFKGHIILDGAVVRALAGSREPAGIDVNSAIIVPLSSDTTHDDRCIVEMVWTATQKDIRVAMARLHVDGGGIVAVPVIREQRSMVELHLGRGERWLPILVGVLGGLATSMAVRSRRGEFAAYVFGGASRVAVAQLVVFESTIIGGVAASSGVLAAIALAPFALAPIATVFAVLALALSWIATALSAALPVAFVSPVEMGKRR